VNKNSFWQAWAQFLEDRLSHDHDVRLKIEERLTVRGVKAPVLVA
jgi:hypothetical protein